MRRQLGGGGLEAALNRRRPPAFRAADLRRREEARLMALACSKPPQGYARWSLRLLESKVVELGIVEPASDSTIRRVLKKCS